MIALLYCLLAVGFTEGLNSQSEFASYACRSNTTHLAWITSSDDSLYGCEWQTLEAAKNEANDYLLVTIMPFDTPFLETLGFHNKSRSEDDTDGLADGLVGNAINLSITAKQRYMYADSVPKNIWKEYVLNYANLNEARTDIRTLLWKRVVLPLLTNNKDEHWSTAQVVQRLNTHMWNLLAPADSESIVFVAGQTPAIFDPMSVMAFGHASCTGLAVLMVQALRAAGIPARVAGTAAWNGHAEHGNHNWVEVYMGGREENWSFLEPSPAQAAIDTVDRNPCERWFCRADRMENTTLYAARLEGKIFFPLAWEEDCTAVTADSRTDYYWEACSKCGQRKDRVGTSPTR